jgi:hypothetical protein
VLTERATRLLSTLQRVPALATREVEAILAGEGEPAAPAWLTFHDRYAGHVEVFGHDAAVWGLAHEESPWLGPRGVYVERDVENGRPTRAILCANVHPSYQYMLYDDGAFLGHGEHDSFERHLERWAAYRAFATDAPGFRSIDDELRTPEARAALLAEVAAYPIAEATDRFAAYYASPVALAIHTPSSGRVRGWRRAAR